MSSRDIQHSAGGVAAPQEGKLHLLTGESLNPGELLMRIGVDERLRTDPQTM